MNPADRVVLTPDAFQGNARDGVGDTARSPLPWQPVVLRLNSAYYLLMILIDFGQYSPEGTSTASHGRQP